MPKVIYKLTGDNEIATRSRRIVHRFGTAHATVAIHTVNIGDTFARYKGSGIVNALWWDEIIKKRVHISDKYGVVPTYLFVSHT